MGGTWSSCNLPRKKRLRVILAGGGSKGCFQVGVLTEILRSGKYTIDQVYGCSIGAILAPLVANERVDLMLLLFDQIKSIDDIMYKRKFIPDCLIGLCVLLNMGPAYESVKLIDTVLDSLTPEEIEVAESKCHVVAHDLYTDSPVWFTGESLERGIRCSSALWIAVPPIENRYADGGLSGLFRDQYILEGENDLDVEYLYIECNACNACNVKDVTKPVPTDPIGMLSTFHSKAISRLNELDLDSFKERLASKLTIIRPDQNYLLNTLDIDPSRMKATLEHGMSKGREFLG